MWNGIGVGIGRQRFAGGGIDAQAQAHFDRVIADGGVVPSGIEGTNSFFTNLKTIYGTSDLSTAISVGYDPQYLGYKLGAGSGATLGQAAQKLYSCIGSSGDVVQTTAASQPLLLVHEGVNYWFGSGVVGNRVETPNSVNNTIDDKDVEIEFKVKPNFSQQFFFISKYASSANGEYTFSFGIDKKINAQIKFVTSGVLSYVTTNVLPFSSNDIFWIKIIRTRSTGIIDYYTSIDGITYTLFESINGAIEDIATSSIPVYITQYRAATSSLGSVYYGSIKLNGVTTQIFNPNQYNAATSQTQWTSSTGEVWTINTGTATTGYKGVLVDRTIVQTDRIDDNLATLGSFSISSNAAIYTATKQYVNNQTNIILSYGLSLNNYLSIYNDSTNRHNVEYYVLPLQKIQRFTGQGIIRCLNADLVNSEVITQYKNNTLQSTSSSTTPPSVTSSAIRIGRLVTSGFYGNIEFTTIILSIVANNTTQSTSMYNYIRSINNNAF